MFAYTWLQPGIYSSGNTYTFVKRRQRKGHVVYRLHTCVYICVYEATSFEVALCHHTTNIMGTRAEDVVNPGSLLFSLREPPRKKTTVSYKLSPCGRKFISGAHVNLSTKTYGENDVPYP